MDKNRQAKSSRQQKVQLPVAGEVAVLEVPPKSIASAAQDCEQEFWQRCHEMQRASPSLQALDVQVSRFKVWAGYIGAFAPGKGSADYRLRHDLDAANLLTELLAKLTAKVRSFGTSDGKTAASGASVDGHAILARGPSISPSPSSSSLSSSPSLVLDSDDDDDDSEPEQSRLEEETGLYETQLRDIQIIISRLYRISTIIRKPTRDNERARVQKFIAEEPFETDLSELETHTRWQVQLRCPRISEQSNLARRLVDGVIYRRQMIMYRARHQEKLEQSTNESFRRTSAETAPETRSAVPELAKTNEATPMKTGNIAGKSQKAVTFVETTASTANKITPSKYAKSGVLTGFTMSQAARRGQLDIPPVPRPVDPKLKEIRCPYCSHIINDELGNEDNMQDTRWRRHVLKDISPYVCLFEGCNTPWMLFKSMEDCLHHMMWLHLTVYSCHFPQHEEAFFTTEKSFIRHLQDEHSESFSEDQTAIILQKAVRPAPDVFVALAARGEGGNAHIPVGLHDDELQLCPLCDFSLTDCDTSDISALDLSMSRLTESVHKEIRDHIALHLETIALLCLPARDDLEDQDSKDRDRASSILSAREPPSSLLTLRSLEDLDEIDNPPLQEAEDVEGERSGFFKTSPFSSSQLGVDGHYMMHRDPILLWYARNDLDSARHYLPFDIGSVRQRFPQCADDIVERLGEENTRRRRVLQFCQNSNQTSRAGAVDRAAEETYNQEGDFRAPRQIRSVHSSNQAATLDSPGIDFALTTFVDTQRPYMRIQECPYGCSIQQIRSGSLWRKHIDSHLMPYTCFWDKSHPPLRSRKAWLQHVKVNHRGNLPVFSDEEYTCPLCFETLSNEKNYERHVGDHLQDLALFVLPPPDPELDSDVAEGGNSANDSRPGSGDDQIEGGSSVYGHHDLTQLPDMAQSPYTEAWIRGVPHALTNVDGSARVSRSGYASSDQSDAEHLARRYSM